MKRYRIRFATNNPMAAWSQLALKTGEMLLASAQVINHRTNRIAMAGAVPNTRDQREFALMGQEKIEAATESAQAIATRMVTMNAQIGTLAFRQMLNGMSGIMGLLAAPSMALSMKGQAELLRDAIESSATVASQLSDSMARLAHHGLKPIHSRATGNAKRLRKIRSRQ
jgi:hypothetical protein